MNIKYFFPPTTTKVNRNTRQRINDKIHKKTKATINSIRAKNENAINARIKELDYEWDTERVLEINFAGIVLITSILALFHNKRWITLAGIASIFMVQHSLQGWCPPLPIIRKCGVRTANEIINEKMALQTILENKENTKNFKEYQNV